MCTIKPFVFFTEYLCLPSFFSGSLLPPTQSELHDPPRWCGFFLRPEILISVQCGAWELCCEMAHLFKLEEWDLGMMTFVAGAT